MKFSNLKELVVSKVRLLIDGLPFTVEEYERAKNILKTKYGKTSEVINAYIWNMMEIPTAYGTNPVKIHEFYKKLLLSSAGDLGKTF